MWATESTYLVPRVVCGPNVDRMSDLESTPLERAIGDEVHDLARRKRMSHKEIQQAAGVGDRSFRRYFVEGSRAIPVDVLARVADALGVSVSALIQGAEGRLDPIPPGEFTKESVALAADTGE